ncbi:MAG: hypothetical protein ABFC57_12450 [Veillonellales bacterium]
MQSQQVYVEGVFSQVTEIGKWSDSMQSQDRKDGGSQQSNEVSHGLARWQGGQSGWHSFNVISWQNVGPQEKKGCEK